MKTKIIFVLSVLLIPTISRSINPELTQYFAAEKEKILAIIKAGNPKLVVMMTALKLDLLVKKSDIIKVVFAPIDGGIFSLTGICKNGGKIVTELDDPYIWRYTNISKSKIRKKI